jgi:ATP-binding cassette subfamily B protein
VARHRGIDATVESLNRKYGHRRGGFTTTTLLSVGSELGLSIKEISVGFGDIAKLRQLLPAILPMRDGTSVILEGISQDNSAGLVVTLVAPAQETGLEASRVVVDRHELGRVWGGTIFLVKRSLKINDLARPFDLTWIVAQLLQERSILRDIAVASLFATTFALAPAFITMIVIDRVIVNHSVSTLWVIIGALIALIVFEMILGFLRRLFILIAATRIDGRLNLYIMERVLRLPIDYFERTPAGYTLGRLGQIGRIRAFMTGQLFGTLLDMVTLIGLIPALLILSWKLSILVFICALAIFFIVYAYLKPLARLHGRVIEAERQKGAFLTETIYGIKAIKSLALEDRRRSEWDIKVAIGLKTSYDWGAMSNYPQTYSLPFERMMFSGSIIFGAAIALSSPTAVYPGSLFAFAMLAGRTAQPLIQLARLMSDWGELQGAIGEVGIVMNERPEDLRLESGLKLPVKGNISFEGVNFRYAAGANLALSGVTFNIKPGAIFGIMGRSGSGKTTITRLLQGLSSNYEGLIKIDGMDLREMDIHHLRLNIGVVPQENFLFSGSIRENIGIASPGATMGQIVRAAQLAGAEEFIERLPRGYETRLEEGASNLSGGQRQRLALARALLIDPPVLILDEATSALDAESEAIINANLARIANERTIICVSHRLSMLVPASAILVMERGKVYDIGRHDELLRRCDIYKHMWYTQNRHIDQSGENASYLIDAT